MKKITCRFVFRENPADTNNNPQAGANEKWSLYGVLSENSIALRGRIFNADIIAADTIIRIWLINDVFRIEKRKIQDIIWNILTVIKMLVHEI